METDINKKAKIITNLCKKYDVRNFDYSIYKNYVIRLYAFGVENRCNESISSTDYNFIIAPRFMEYCLDKRKNRKWLTIHRTILNGFKVVATLEREKNEKNN